MLSLIILVIFGTLVAVFAVQNTQNASVFFGQYGLVDIPLYAIALGAMLFGIFVSWLVSLGGFVSNFMTLRGKEGRIRDANEHIHKLEDRVHDLELENAKLRGEDPHVEHEERTEHRPVSPFTKLRERFS